MRCVIALKTSVICSLALFTGCFGYDHLTAKVKDPTKVVVQIAGSSGPVLTGGQGEEAIDIGHHQYVVKHRGSIRVAWHELLSGDEMGPFMYDLGRYWRPGKKQFGVASSVLLDYTSFYRDDIITNSRTYYWSKSSMPYTISTPIENVDYFKEPDQPARAVGGIALGMGLGMLLGGWWLAGHDAWYAKYPGYVFVVGGAVSTTMGIINVARPKRKTKWTRVNADRSVTETRADFNPFDPEAAAREKAAVERKSGVAPSIDPSLAPPPVAGYTWVPWSGKVPSGAVEIGIDPGPHQYHRFVCRMMVGGELQIGQFLTADSRCTASRKGGPAGRAERGFEILVGPTRWDSLAIVAVAGGGNGKGVTYSVCRTKPFDAYIGGQLIGEECHFNSRSTRAFEVLSADSAAGSGPPTTSPPTTAPSSPVTPPVIPPATPRAKPINLDVAPAMDPTKLPPTPAGLRWEAFTGTVPTDSVLIAVEPGAPKSARYICRMAFQGGVHVGQYMSTSTLSQCSVHTKEGTQRAKSGFEILAGEAHWESGVQTNAVVAGKDATGGEVRPCRGTPLKHMAGGEVIDGVCTFAGGVTATTFEVLVPGP